MPSDTYPVSDQFDYATLLRTRNARKQVGLGFISRLPVGAAGVAIVIAVSESSGSYYIAGWASAIYALFAAIMAPIWARVMDRRGQNNTLWRNGIVQFFLYGLLAILCHIQASAIFLLLSCGMIGFFSLDIGSVVRSRWVTTLAQEQRQRTAFMFESAIDEAVFAIAPVLVTAVAVLQTPFALSVIAVGPLIGWVGLSRLSEPDLSEHKPQTTLRAAGSIIDKRFLLLLAVFVSIGGMLGSIEVILVASAMEDREPIFAGFALAGWATGSGLTALALGKHLSRFRAKAVSTVGIFVMTFFTFLLSIDLTPFYQIACCFLAGAGAAPAISSGFSLSTRYVSSDRVTEALAMTATGLGLGTVAGASLGGFASEYYSFQQAYYLSVCFGLLAAVFCFCNQEQEPQSL